MERSSVRSSHISSIGYDPDTLVLEVEFNDGSVYQYHDVPNTVYEGLMDADSHGEYLHEWVKGEYDYTQIR